MANHLEPNFFLEYSASRAKCSATSCSTSLESPKGDGDFESLSAVRCNRQLVWVEKCLRHWQNAAVGVSIRVLQR